MLAQILDENNPDAEGQYIGDELHAYTCPCEACAEEKARWERLWAEGDNQPDEERLAAMDAAVKAARAKREADRDAEDAAIYKEGMRIWDKALAEVRAQNEARAQAACQEWDKQQDEELADQARDAKARELELKARERAVKDRELSRREKRQDGYDADDDDESGQVEGGEPLAAFETPMDGSDLDIAPTAMLQRMDGEPLLYKGKINWLFGSPGGGKSWIALYCVHETLLQGHRVAYWDHEDVAATQKRRSNLLGLDLVAAWGEGQFKYIRTGMDGSSLAMAEVMEWATGGDGPTLIVIDSAESAGCPSDGADVAPWLARFVKPFNDAGCTVLVLDHVAKHKEGRPLGPIGSQHKLAKVDGGGPVSDGCSVDSEDGRPPSLDQP